MKSEQIKGYWRATLLGDPETETLHCLTGPAVRMEKSRIDSYGLGLMTRGSRVLFDHKSSSYPLRLNMTETHYEGWVIEGKSFSREEFDAHPLVVELALNSVLRVLSCE